MARKTTVLVADSEATALALTADGLRMHGFNVVTARTGEEAERILRTSPIAVLVTAVDLRGAIDGLRLARTARELDRDVGVIYSAPEPHTIPARSRVPGAPVIRSPYRASQVASIIGSLKSSVEQSSRAA